MFKSAYGFDDETVFYFDSLGNKYVAQGGSFAWRINNPGLIRSHCHFAGKNGSIGSLRGFAIFPRPEQGRKALSDLLKAKKYYKSTLLTIALHYQPDDPGEYLLRLMSYAPVPADRKICSLSRQEFDCLILAVEKLCGYTSIGNESFTLLPRIYAHFENSHTAYDTYAITDNTILSKEEVVERILTHRLDGIIVHHDDGTIHVRSRPSYSMWNIHMPAKLLPPIDGAIDTITRSVGEKRKGQCIWGFINGIYNERGDALESAK
jgi:predicted small metal-binding protein